MHPNPDSNPSPNPSSSRLTCQPSAPPWRLPKLTRTHAPAPPHCTYGTLYVRHTVRTGYSPLGYACRASCVPYVHYALGRAYGWVASTIPLRAVPMPYLCRTYAVPEARGSLPLGPPRTVRPPRTRTSTTRPTVRTQRPTVRIQRTRSGGFSTPCHLVDLYEQLSSSTTALNLGPAPRINGKRRADSTTSTRLSLSLSLSLALSLTRQTL